MSTITKQTFLVPKAKDGVVSLYNERTDLATTYPNVTDGRYPLFKKVGNKGKLNVKEGELVFWDPSTGKSLALGDTPNKFNISVACKNAKGKLTLRHASYGEYGYDTCSLNMANTSLPQCGQGPIKDVYFDCVGCGDTVTAYIGWENQQVKDQFPDFRFAEESFSVTVPCEKCVDCPVDNTTCEDFVDKLITRINEGNSYRYDFGLIDGVDKSYKAPSPFSAHRIFGETYTFCGSITPSSGCDGKCCCLTTLDSITLGDQTWTPDVELDFQDPEATYQYMKDFKEEFDSFFDGKAFIHFAMGVGTCCPYKIYIDTCIGVPEIIFDGVALTTADAYQAALDPTSDEFDKVAYDAATTDEEGNFKELCMTLPGCGLETSTPGILTCETCERLPIDKEWNCGIRVYLDPVKLECGECNFPALPAKWYYGSALELRIEGAGEWKAVDRQVSKMPLNTGYQVQQLELAQETYGDDGRDYSTGYRLGRGVIGLPDYDSRLRSLKTDCSKTYCLFNLGGRNRFYGSNGIDEGGRANRVNTTIAFESGVDTSNFFDFLNPLITKDCCSLQAVHCNPDGEKTIHGDGTGTTPSNITSKLTY